VRHQDVQNWEELGKFLQLNSRKKVRRFNNRLTFISTQSVFYLINKA